MCKDAGSTTWLLITKVLKFLDQKSIKAWIRVADKATSELVNIQSKTACKKSCQDKRTNGDK